MGKRPPQRDHDTWVANRIRKDRPTPSQAVVEGFLLHALRRVRHHPHKEHPSLPYRYVGLQAGNEETQRGLERWVVTGELALQCCFASDIVDTLEHLVEELQCTLVIRELPEGHFEKAKLTGQQDADIIYATAERMQKFIQRQAWGRWGEHIANPMDSGRDRRKTENKLSER